LLKSVSDVLEHVRNLPELLNVHFQTLGCLLVMTVNANTLLGTFSVVPEALAIFFLAINFGASAWWELSGFADILAYGRLLCQCGVFRLEGESVLFFLYVKLGIFQ
jgi:hypothetical protein